MTDTPAERQGGSQAAAAARAGPGQPDLPAGEALRGGELEGDTLIRRMQDYHFTRTCGTDHFHVRHIVPHHQDERGSALCGMAPWGESNWKPAPTGPLCAGCVMCLSNLREAFKRVPHIG